jgi:hypothetical protein
VLGRYPNCAGMGKTPIPTVPSTRNGGMYKYVGGDDDDWEFVALGGALTILFSLLFFIPDSLLFYPSQRARPSYNPRGTCLRWADTPAAPGWAKPRSRQFRALEGGEGEIPLLRGRGNIEK